MAGPSVEASLNLLLHRRPVALSMAANGRSSAGAGWFDAVRGTARDITERKQAEEAIEESELRYRFLFDNMRDGLAYCRMLYEQDRPQDFIYLAVNPAFTTLTGLADVVGRKVSEVVPGIRESDPQLFEVYGRVARTGVPEQFEIFVDAMKMWFAISVYSPSRDHFVAVFEVITERKRTEEDLRVSRQRIALHLEQTPLAVIEFDLEGIVREWNPAAAQMFGYSREEAIGQHWTFIVPRTVWDSLEGVWDNIVARRGGTRSTNENRTKDGRTINCEWFSTPLIDPDGTAMGVASLVMDVTDRARAERQVERLKNHLASVIDSMPSMLVGIDRGRPGHPVEPPGGDRHRAFVRPTPSRNPWRPYCPTSSSRSTALRLDLSRVVPASVQGVPIDRNGERRLFDVMLYPLAADSFDEVVVRIEDVTARSREQRLLLQIEKMTSIGGLAAGLAHEINNPLGIITQAVQNVEQRTSLHLPANLVAAATVGTDLETVCAYHDLREIPAFLKDIREAAGRAAHIVTNMLAFSRTGDTARLPADLSQLLEHSVLLAASDFELSKRYAFREYRYRQAVRRERARCPGGANRDRAGLPQPADQCRARGLGEPARASAADCPAPVSRREIRGRPDPRQRAWHDAGHPASRLRTVLHDQAARFGHRPRPVGCLYHRDPQSQGTD